jgi:hypothetical protein
MIGIMPMARDKLVNHRFVKLELLDEAMVEVLSSKTGAERLAIAAGMFRSARRMISSHLRQQHPDWDSSRLEREVARRLSHGSG